MCFENIVNKLEEMGDILKGCYWNKMEEMEITDKLGDMKRHILDEWTDLEGNIKILIIVLVMIILWEWIANKLKMITVLVVAFIIAFLFIIN